MGDKEDCTGLGLCSCSRLPGVRRLLQRESWASCTLEGGPPANLPERTASIGAAVGAETKRRWDLEEVAAMAMEEARLCRRAVKTIKGVAIVNAAAAASISNRTIESINGQPRRPGYKSLVDSYMSVSPEETMVPQRHPSGTTDKSTRGQIRVSPNASGAPRWDQEK